MKWASRSRPNWGQAGGYTLPSDYSLPPLALTLHEALLLRLALSSLSQLGETPFKQARESLLAKVQTLLPRHEDENLEQFTQTLFLDIPTRDYPTPFLDQLLENARARRWIVASYRSEKGVSRQTLLPIHLILPHFPCSAIQLICREAYARGQRADFHFREATMASREAFQRSAKGRYC